MVTPATTELRSLATLLFLVSANPNTSHPAHTRTAPSGTPVQDKQLHRRVSSRGLDPYTLWLFCCNAQATSSWARCTCDLLCFAFSKPPSGLTDLRSPAPPAAPLLQALPVSKRRHIIDDCHSSPTHPTCVTCTHSYFGRHLGGPTAWLCAQRCRCVLLYQLPATIAQSAHHLLRRRNFLPVASLSCDTAA